MWQSTSGIGQGGWHEHQADPWYGWYLGPCTHQNGKCWRSTWKNGTVGWQASFIPPGSLKQEGLGTVPASIHDEIAELLENLPDKREDESLRSSSTWRRKFHVTSPESEPPAQRRPGYPPPSHEHQPHGTASASSGLNPPPPPPPPAPRRSNPTTGEWLGLNNQQVERRSNTLRTALMSQMSNSSPVPTQTSVEEVSPVTKAQTSLLPHFCSQWLFQDPRGVKLSR